MNLFVHFIPNLYFNLLFVFFISYFLVELLIWALNIRSVAWQYFLRLIPCLKLLVDPFQYQFHRWALFHNESILNQLPNSRQLDLSLSFQGEGLFYRLFYYLGLSMKEGELHFGLFDPLFEKIGAQWAYLISCLILLPALIKLILWSNALIKEMKTSFAYEREYPFEKIATPLLVQIYRQKVKVVISNHHFETPYVKYLGQREIVLPHNVEDILTSDEINAVIAHELGHLNQFHLTFFIVVSFLQNLFYFVPTYRLKLTLEKMCDQFAAQFSNTPRPLMTALLKITRTSQLKKITSLSFAPLNQTQARLLTLLEKKDPLSIFRKALYTLIALLLFSIVIFSKVGHF